MKRYFLLLIVCFSFLPFSVQAETSKETRLTDYLEKYLEQEKIPGASISIVSKGETVYSYNWGVTGEDEQPITSQTPFALGSISKSFTGLAIAKLIDEEKLSLDDKVSDLLPSLHWQGIENSITIHHLLTHTSGISSYDGLKVADLGITEQIELNEIVHRLSEITLTHPPGSVHQYSPANYLILGSIIEEITNQRYAEYMHQHIFSPLEMTNTAADGDAANRTGYRSGYQSWFGYPVKSKVAYDNSGAPYSTITSSAEEMTQFISLLSGRSSEKIDDSILNRYTEKLYERKSKVYYGYGLRHTKLDSGKDIVWHSGSTPDAHAELFYIPEDDWGAIILTNKNHIFEETSLPLLKQGIIDIMQDTEPTNIHGYFPIFQVILCILLVVLLIWTVYLIKKRKTFKKTKRLFTLGTLSLVSGVIVIPSLIYMTQAPWRSISAFAPDIAFLTLSLVVLMISCGIICLLISLRKSPN